MKKLILSQFIICACLVSFGQSQKNLVPQHLKSVKADGLLTPGNGTELRDFIPPSGVEMPKPTPTTKMSYTEWIVGESYYDLQTNSTIMNRLAKSGNDRSLAFTYSSEPSGYSDRGTGYNWTNDDFWNDIPLERIESIRTGWPSVLHTTNHEIVISHEFPLQLIMSKSPGIGEENWTEEILEHDIPEGTSWSRAVAGGSDGNSIHMISITIPEATQGVEPGLETEGLDGAILYSRSTDEGETWDIYNTVIPGMDSTAFLGLPVDAYSIFSRGDNVAIAVFNDWADSFVMISADNGDTWGKRILVDFPVDMFEVDESIIDLDEDLLADTLYNTDTSGALFIDSSGETHVMWGHMFYIDDVIGDGQWQYFPYTDGLAYWNASMDDNSWDDVAFVQDADGSGEIELAEDIGTYFLSLTSMPQLAEDGDGNLYASYSGVTEGHQTGTQNYRHLYLLKSEDGGDSWSDPVDATPDLDFIGYECVFPSMAPEVDDFVHILYQRDGEPGLAVQGDLDPPAINEMIYFRITNDLAVEEVVSIDQIKQAQLSAYPNPSTGQFTVNGIAIGVQLQIIDATGRVAQELRLDESKIVDLSGMAPGIYTMSPVGESVGIQLIIE